MSPCVPLSAVSPHHAHGEVGGSGPLPEPPLSQESQVSRARCGERPRVGTSVGTPTGSCWKSQVIGGGAVLQDSAGQVTGCYAASALCRCVRRGGGGEDT